MSNLNGWISVCEQLPPREKNFHFSETIYVLMEGPTVHDGLNLAIGFYLYEHLLSGPHFKSIEGQSITPKYWRPYEPVVKLSDMCLGIDSVVTGYEYRTKDHVIDIVHNLRKMTLKQDLRRHQWEVVKTWLGISSTNIDDLPQMYDWILRLEKIIGKPNSKWVRNILEWLSTLHFIPKLKVRGKVRGVRNFSNAFPFYIRIKNNQIIGLVALFILFIILSIWSSK